MRMPARLTRVAFGATLHGPKLHTTSRRVLMNKKQLSERDICTKFIVPAITSAGWDIQDQVREEYFFTAGQVHVRGKTVKRGKRKFADFLLSWKPNIPLALIEAKDNNHSVGSGMQQGLDYAGTLDIPCMFSTNGERLRQPRSRRLRLS